MKKRLFLVVMLVCCVVGLSACSMYDPNLASYDMKVYDLSNTPENIDGSYQYMFDKITVGVPEKVQTSNKGSQYYLGHPDNVMLDNGDILTAYPIGHGKGQTIIKRSTDKGLTWGDVTGLPETFKLTEETPTIYKLDFKSGEQKLVMISGRPGWGGKGEGFDVTLSNSVDSNGKSDGKVWESHKNFFGPNAEPNFYEKAGKFEPIVAMASLTQVKDSSGKFADKWMGIFHDYEFNVYKSFLTFDTNGDMYWSRPARIFNSKQRAVEKKYNFCEPEVVRSPEGNELAILFRANAKKSYSYVAFSTDEGNTWTNPQNLSRELTGERHKAEYDPVTGKLLISYRAINWKVKQELNPNAWYSRGWLTWVGDYSDLHKGLDGKGDFVIKMAHTYLDKQTVAQESANGDTGYAGLTIDQDGLVVMTSYGMFSPYNDSELGGKTYIITKRFKINDIKAVFGA